MFLSASLIAGAVSLPVRVRNLSPRGALVDGGIAPPARARIRLERGELGADGEIAWVANGQVGFRFDCDIEVADWVQRVGHAG